MNNCTLSQQVIFTIHTDVITEWRKKIRDVQLIGKEFTNHIEAQATLDRVKKSNPKAFIKTRVIH